MKQVSDNHKDPGPVFAPPQASWKVRSARYRGLCHSANVFNLTLAGSLLSASCRSSLFPRCRKSHSSRTSSSSCPKSTFPSITLRTGPSITLRTGPSITLRTGPFSTQILPGIKQQRMGPKALDRTEIYPMIQGLEERLQWALSYKGSLSGHAARAKRDMAIVMLLLHTGLRTLELVGLTLGVKRTAWSVIRYNQAGTFSPRAANAGAISLRARRRIGIRMISSDWARGVPQVKSWATLWRSRP